MGIWNMGIINYMGAMENFDESVVNNFKGSKPHSDFQMREDEQSLNYWAETVDFAAPETVL